MGIFTRVSKGNSWLINGYFDRTITSVNKTYFLVCHNNTEITFQGKSIKNYNCANHVINENLNLISQQLNFLLSFAFHRFTVQAQLKIMIWVPASRYHAKDGTSD